MTANSDHAASATFFVGEDLLSKAKHTMIQEDFDIQKKDFTEQDSNLPHLLLSRGEGLMLLTTHPLGQIDNCGGTL